LSNFEDAKGNRDGAFFYQQFSITKLIAKLKISVERKYFHPFFKHVDQDKSGSIDNAEFEKTSWANQLRS